MAQLVFKGHSTRGKELHKLLEYLGGTDSGYTTFSCVTCFYYINREGYIEGSIMIPDYMKHRIIMSLETFESKYPYKVGDKVNAGDEVMILEAMKMENSISSDYAGKVLGLLVEEGDTVQADQPLVVIE